MKSVCCYIGLGSNLGNPGQQINVALEALRETASIHSVEISPPYRSKAVGPGEQPDYCNAVARIQTSLSPPDLLEVLQTIEEQQGRDRVNSERWGARTLDLDILMYGNEQISLPELCIPHVEIKNRNFVLKPLVDIAPDLVIPGVGPVSELLASVGDAGLQPWGDQV